MRGQNLRANGPSSDATVDRETVVMLHCSASSGVQWAPFREQLGDQFDVIAPDQWGCGDAAPWPGQEAFSLAGEAGPILDLIDRQRRAVHLVGHSYGGALALHIAHRFPQAVSSLTLIEPSNFHLLPYGGQSGQSLFGEIHDVAQTVNEALLNGNNWRGAAAFVNYWNGTGASSEISENGRQRLSAGLTKVVLDFCALFIEKTKPDDFTMLALPTMIIRGSHSPGPSCRIVEMLSKKLPFAHVEVIAGAGHMSPFTHREHVHRLIADHLMQHTVDDRIAA